MMKSFQGLAFAVALALFATHSGTAKAVPMLIVENGELLGADNVDVNGTLFDVRFRDGTCSAIFSGCDNPSEDFAFADANSAKAAAQALLDQVFLDGPAGLFDSNPELTLGCSASELCLANIPYAQSVPGKFEFVSARNLPDLVEPPFEFENTGDSDFDFSDNGFAVFAVFTSAGPSVAVPEPASLALFSFGLAGFIFARRGRSQRAT
ncbi:PEP-CTERM sorting domain-containing protein [Denitrobaculum tricleocarpae]|nr:PEP-CTERM sorting domain-containing protein [Denitrobaculum tricleocarpae]